MSKKRDLIGQKFGNLVVIAEAETKRLKNGQSSRQWSCLCGCGKYKNFSTGSLTSGNSSSCGCRLFAKNRDHGMWNTKIYKVWADMKTRCNNPRNKFYHRYGGRGISYCTEWENFNNFLADMGDTYEEGLSLDRINNDGWYCKENCRWATQKQQALNSRTGRINKTGVVGVYAKNKSDGVWYVAEWTDIDGKRHSKWFSVKKHGENAIDLAKQARAFGIAELEKHGLTIIDEKSNRTSNTEGE